MKWPGEDPNLLNPNNPSGHSVPVGGGLPPRSQDDTMIGYVLQRGGMEPEFSHPGGVPPMPGKLPARWTLNGEQLGQHLPNPEQVLLMNTELAMMHHASLPMPSHMQTRPIASSAKKLWGVEEQREDNKGLLHLNDHQNMWRDSTWSTAGDHAVSQPISMVPRRSGSYPGSDAASMLSPRSTDTGGLGVKMVEYVLSSSPTGKDIDSRMRSLVLNSNDKEKKDKELNKPPSSPYDKKDDVNGNAPQTNGHASNGLSDEDKTFNRTPGSRQPSPAEEEQNKNNAPVMTHMPTAGPPIHAHHPSHVSHVTHTATHAAHATHPNHVNAGPKPMQQPHAMTMDSMHLTPTMLNGLSHLHHPQVLNGNLLSLPSHEQFEHVLDHAGFEYASSAGGPVGAVGTVVNAQPPNAVQAGPATGMESPSVLPQNLDLQQLFRSQQQPPGTGTPQQIQVLQQQQYLQQQAAAAQQQQLAFNTAPYVINAQEPYILAGPTVLPQYYGVAPWSVYPASIIQQNAAGQQRRPMSPTTAAAAAAAAAASTDTGSLTQGQYIIPYYDQNGSIVMGNVRGLGNTGPMRLVSPAPMLVNAATSGSSMRLLGNQPQQIATPPSAASLYSTSQPSLYSSSAAANGSLGLNASSGRRDSFDRNTSAFSPSLEYSRGKWNTGYGGLASMTAQHSPLGLTGSLTPPPPSLAGALGSSTNLQLGALMSNRVLSAAPGAEAVAKYRNGLATATMFGSSGSLLTKLTAAAARPTGCVVDKPAGRSRLLEDFRNNRFPSLSLRDLSCHIVEFSQDQHGSRFIQQKLERATVAEKQMVFSEILPSAYNLMTDVFGNYVIQKFFEFGTPEQKTTLAQKVRGHVLLLALQMYGCRVIQKALESVTPEQQQDIVHELDGHVLKCVKDQNGNHVVQKCIECVDPHALQFVINAFSGQVFALSTHPYGCRVIQRILEHCTPEQTTLILDELHSHAEQLVQDQYGNYVIQHVLEHGKAEDKSKIINNVRGKVLALSQHKFASNVVEKCVTHATRSERSVLIEEVCNFNDNALQLMMRDQYANYVVQKMIDVCEHAQRKVLMHKIRGHISALRKYTYGKHIIAKLDKFFMKTPNMVTSLPSVTSELL